MSAICPPSTNETLLGMCTLVLPCKSSSSENSKRKCEWRGCADMRSEQGIHWRRFFRTTASVSPRCGLQSKWATIENGPGHQCTNKREKTDSQVKLFSVKDFNIWKRIFGLWTNSNQINSIQFRFNYYKIVGIESLLITSPQNINI